MLCKALRSDKFFSMSEWKKLGIPPIIVKWKTPRSLRAICSSRVLRLWDLSMILQVKALQTKPCIYSRSPPPNVAGISDCKCHTSANEMPLFSIPVQGSSIHGTTLPRILEPRWKEDGDCALDQVSFLKKQGKSSPKEVWNCSLYGLWFSEREVELAWP